MVTVGKRQIYFITQGPYLNFSIIHEGVENMRILAGLFLMLPMMAAAEPYTVETVLKDTTTIVAVDINPKTVFCTDRGYSNIQLKVSLPDLDWLAHFDHRVVGERLPCITGGACSDALQPGNIIDLNEPIVLAPVRVVLTQTLTVDDASNACTQTLSEEITSLIRGRTFKHFRAGEPTPIDMAKCHKLVDAR